MTPILYTTENCPHCTRALMGLAYAGVHFEVRKVNGSHPPEAMRRDVGDQQPPILKISNNDILSNSMEILHWALLRSDGDGWLDFEVDELDEMHTLVQECDGAFTRDLRCYCQPEAGQDKMPEQARDECRPFLNTLEERLHQKRFLFANRVSYADIALFPFVKQFADADQDWFYSSCYIYLRAWLNYHGESRLYQLVMNDYPAWQPEGEVHYFSLQG